MREWCACGGSIRATTRQVIRWRTQHHCPTRPEPEPDNIVQVQGAQIENAARNEWHGLEARIGFTKEQP